MRYFCVAAFDEARSRYERWIAVRYEGKYRQMEKLMMKEVLVIIVGLLVLSAGLLGFVVHSSI